MNTLANLHREYARVIEMCEGTEVKPWRCVKYAAIKELRDSFGLLWKRATKWVMP